MPRLWERSLLFRTVGSIVAITLVVGGLIMVTMSVVVARQAEADAYKRLGELLDTVESTVRIACFVGDEELAREVSRGLLKSSEVRLVVIASDRSELARLQRPEVPHKTTAPGSEPLQRRIASPFDNSKFVGSISLYPDVAAIDTLVAGARRQMALQMGLLIVAVVVALTLTVLRQVLKPLGGLSLRLHRLDAGTGHQLTPPPGHEHNAFGSLTRDINALTKRLVATIEVEQALHQQHEMDERKYRGIFENAETGIFIADRGGLIESYNRSLAQLTGLMPPGTDGRPPASLVELPWSDPDHIAALIATCVDANATTSDDVELKRAAAPRRWLNLTLTPIGDALVQGIVSDVTERRNAEASARRLAVTDSLTGLANRQGFETHWAQEIKTRPDRNFALLLVDLEGFKQLNDALGFPAGDRVLIGMGARIVAAIKGSDWVARIGGDEFAIILPDVDEPGTVGRICQRIIASLGEVFSVSGQETCLGASIGATFFPADGTTLPTLLRNAELSLASARASGGRTWALFDQHMIQAVEQRQHLANDLRLAADRGELRLFYQPIVDLRSHRVAGAEALIRWQHPSHGLVPPDSFIPLAEQTGLINGVGDWCLDTACRQLAAWQAAGLDLYLTINVSARQIPDGLPPERIAAKAAEYGIAPNRLGLEITEGLLLSETGGAQSWLEAVRARGFRAYLDDFGTGYSSLSYLKRFRVDTVKIDKAFVRDMSEISSDRVMVEAVIMMADSLELTVVAEGIENTGQLDILCHLGCRYGQGYHFCRPVPADQFLAQVERIDNVTRPVPA